MGGFALDDLDGLGACAMLSDGSALSRGKSTINKLRGWMCLNLKQKHAVTVAEKTVLLLDRVGVGGQH
jgi:hypothetical protein